MLYFLIILLISFRYILFDIKLMFSQNLPTFVSIETQFQKEIQSFQYDNVGEYNNRQFHELYNSNGIQINL